MIWLLSSLALAGGTFHPNDVASASALYAKASAEAGQTFQQLDERQRGLAQALQDYQLALDLLGDRAPAAEQTRLDELQLAFNREQAVLGAFASTMMEDFDGEFTTAMERALTGEEGELTQCERQIAAAPALPGMPTRTKANPDCQGEDRSPALAARMDADPALQQAVREILGLPWPEITIEAVPQAPVGGTQWIAVAPFFSQHAREALRRIDIADEEAREPFWAAIEAGATVEERQELLAKAQALTEQTATQRASLAAPVLDAVDAAVAKKVKKGQIEPTGWCANPALLGSCGGTDVTRSLGNELVGDRKVAKALPGG